MATIEAFRHGDEVCIKAPGSPIMTVLAVEGLKVRCTDRENLQYWFDSIMLERYEHLRQHPVCESVNANDLELPDDLESYSQHEALEDETVQDRSVELPSDFWVYAEQLRRAPLTLAA